MKLLLDTQLLIWTAAGNLPSKAIHYIIDNSNSLYFSAASIWEIVIKSSLERKDFVIDPHILYDNLLVDGYEELPVTSRHSLAVKNLPMLHKDPFDRIFLAQSIIENIPILTSDELIKKYPASVIYVN